MAHKLSTALFLVTLLCLGLSGCTTPSVQDVMQAAKEAAQKADPLNPTFEGDPVDIYSQIAKGSNTCWFSPQSTLRKSYIFFAVTSPDRKHAQIGIHELARDGERGLKAFSINIWSTDKGTAIASANHRLRKEISEQMESDVTRWAAGDESCSEHLKPPFAAQPDPSVKKDSAPPVVTPANAGPKPKI